ncbi:MAG: deoxyribodipyrimidine photo-lyase, partial [Porticoccaceae bacterium]
MLKIGIFLFSNDLRLEDNPALALACREMDKLVCLYCPSQPSTKTRVRGPGKLSHHRLHFLQQSLQTLDQNLHSQQQHLLVREQPLLDAVAELITLHDVTHLYRSCNAGWYENHEWNTLVSRYPGIVFQQKHSHTLFTQDELPFELSDLPTSFSKFRRLIEPITASPPTLRPPSMPPSPSPEVASEFLKTNIHEKNSCTFEGGENAGHQHLNSYFSQKLASSYKLTRNGLDGMDYSTKFSPWLSNGCLSVRSVIARLRDYENDIESNDSTYWIY